MHNICDSIEYIRCHHYGGYNLDKEGVYVLADIIRVELGVSRSHPLDPYSLISKYPNALELGFHNFDAGNFGGMLIKNNPKYHVSTIILNEARAEASQKFTCAHELVHFFADSTDLFVCNDTLSSSSIVEWRANECAAELLMPFRKIVPWLAEKADAIRKAKLSAESASNVLTGLSELIADKYGVSNLAATYRMKNLEYEVWQFLNGTSIEHLSMLSNTRLRKSGIKYPPLLHYCVEKHRHTPGNVFTPTKKTFVTDEEEHLLETIKLGKV